MGNHITVVLLHVVGPCRTAAGDLRDGTVTGGKSLNELTTLFHDGEVCREVRIEDFIDSESSESRIDLTGGDRTSREVECFTEGDTHCRGDLHNHMLMGIIDRTDQILSLILLVDGTDRTVSGTLAAFDTGAVVERQRCCRGHECLVSTTDELKGKYSLLLLTDLYTSSALDTLGGVKDERGGRCIFRQIHDPSVRRAAAAPRTRQRNAAVHRCRYGHR